MVHAIGRTALMQLQSLPQGFLQDGALPFSSVLTVQDLVDLLSQTCVETCDRIFTPMVTLWTFVSQRHSDDPSCRAAVARLNATRVAQGLEPGAPLTGGYGKARQRLAEPLLHRLMHQSGQRLGHEDHRLPWSKPKRPTWLDEATYVGVPAIVEMRAWRVRVTQRGFRTRVMLVATTVLAPEAFAKEEGAGLSRARWHAALDLRAIKQTMQMDVLRCKTPAMVRKESWGPLLVDNLLRAAMAQAALRQGMLARQVRLQGARQTLEAFRSQVRQASPTQRAGIIPMC